MWLMRSLRERRVPLLCGPRPSGMGRSWAGPRGTWEGGPPVGWEAGTSGSSGWGRGRWQASQQVGGNLGRRKGDGVAAPWGCALHSPVPRRCVSLPGPLEEHWVVFTPGVPRGREAGGCRGAWIHTAPGGCGCPSLPPRNPGPGGVPGNGAHLVPPLEGGIHTHSPHRTPTGVPEGVAPPAQGTTTTLCVLLGVPPGHRGRIDLPAQGVKGSSREPGEGQVCT